VIYVPHALSDPDHCHDQEMICSAITAIFIELMNSTAKVRAQAVAYRQDVIFCYEKILPGSDTTCERLDIAAAVSQD
jgi:uncharacterized protein YsxB (DUF464 family)